MPQQKEYITTTDAMKMASVTRMTIINWIHVYGIGKKVAGRWKIDVKSLTKILEGRNG